MTKINKMSTSGTMFTRWLICLLFLTGLWTSNVNAQTITIGTGASTSTAGTNGDPIYRSSAASGFNWSQSVHLLTQAQLSAAGLTAAKDITSMAFYKTTANTLTAGRTATLKIYMKSSCATALVTTQTMAQWISGATLVYNNTNVLPADLAVSGAVTFPFSTNFVYPGVGGIEIAVDWSINTGSGNPTTGSFQWTYNSTTPIQAVGTSNSAVITSALTTSQVRSYRMNLTLATPTATCFAPACPVGTATSPSTANVSWTAPAPAPGVGYEYAVTTSSTPPASGTAIAGTSTSATGLSGNTTYYLHVRSDCGGSGFSTWSTSSPFLTPCSPLSVPYNEGFESAVVPNMPACVTKPAGDGAGTVTRSTTTTGAAPRTGTQYLNIRWTPVTVNTIYSAPLSLTGGTSYDFSAWYLTDAISGWTNIRIFANTTPSATGATQLAISPTNEVNTIYKELKGSYTPGTTGTYYMIVQVTHNTTPNDMSIDDISVIQTPTCIAPTLPTGTATGPTTANISWTAAVPVPSVGYQYAVTTSATPPGSGTATTSTSASVTGLTANTVYYVHVRSECTGPDYSPWVTSSSFTTPCNALSLPWSEGFESMATVGTNLYPSCWSYSNVTSSNYSCNGTCNSNTAHAGTKFIGGSWSFNVWYFTPSFNLTAGTSYDFSYWVKTTDAVVGYNLSTFYGTSQTIGAMTNSIGTPVTGYNVATWTKVTATFTPATSGTYYFGLNNNCPTSAPNGIGFDDFALDVTPSCVAPTLPSGTATGTTTANISWTAAVPAPSNGYQYAVTTSATPPGSGTAFAGTSTSVSGLTANTVYYVHVRSDCGGTFSPWATSAATFTTFCNAITSLISESFNTIGSIPPACWSTAIQNGTINWTFASADADGQFTPHSGAAMPVKNWTSAANSDALLISPNLDYSGTYPSTSLRVNVWIYRNASFGLSTDRVAFYANTTNSLSGSPTTLLDIPYAASAAPAVGSSGWYNYTAVIPLSYNSAPFYVIAKGSTTTSFSSYSVGFDDFAIEVAPSCLNPTGLTAGNFTSTTADVSWGSVAGAVNYVWELRTSGACGSGSPLQSGTTASTSVSLSGLSVGTNYTFCVYTDCGGGNLSSTSSFTFALPLPGDDFCNAINLTLGGAQDCKNTTNYTSVGDPGFTCSSMNNTVWYTYTPAVTGQVFVRTEIPISAGNPLDGWLQFYTATGTCPSLTLTEVGTCTNFGFGTNGQVDNTLSPTLTGGVTYYILIDGFSGDVGEYCIEIDAPPTCFPPTSPFATTASNNATLSWTCTGCTGTYEVEYGLTGFTQGTGITIDPATNPTNLSGLAYNTTYDFYVRQDCGAGDWSTWTGPTSFTTGGPPPANDLCSGAITLTCGSTVSGTLVDATLDAGLPAGCGGGNGQYVSASVWYQIVGNGQNYEISLCNSNTTIDTKLSVFSGTCGSLVCEDNNDDDGSCGVNTAASTVSFPTQNGVTYYILVHRYSNIAGGTFDISVTCTTCTPAAGNDNCAGAATLTNGVLLATNNTCAGGAPANPSCNGFQSAFDVWYKINSGLSTNMQIDLAAVTASGLRYAVYYGSCGSLTSVYCNTAPPASNTITLLGTPTDYYIQVWSTSVSTRGDFNLTATLSGGPCMAANANFVSPACAGSALGLTSNVTFGTGPYSYQWSGTGTFSSGSSQNTNVTGAATGTYTVTITDNGNVGCSITKTVSVTLNPAPIPVVQGGNPTETVCEGLALTLSANNAAGGQTTSYSWSTNATLPFTSTQQTPTVTSSAAAGNAGLYTVVLTNQFLCTASGSVTAIINANPTLGGTVTNVSCWGTSNICDGAILASASGGSGSNYVYDDGSNFNADGDFSLNQPLGPVAVCFGPYAITVTDGNGCSTTNTFNVGAISVAPPTASVLVPPIVNLPQFACNGTLVNNINVPVVAGGTTKYIWDGPSGTTFNGGVNPYTTPTPNANITFGGLAVGASGYYIGVQAANGCGATLRKVQWVRGTLSVPTVSGPSEVCAGGSGVYTVTNAPIGGAQSYTWSGPSGTTFNGNPTPYTGTSTSVTAVLPLGYTSGSICVTANASCISTVPKCITVSTSPASIGVMSGVFSVCPNTSQVYSVPNGGSGTYNWTLPANASGSSTGNSITVTFSGTFTGGNISVTYTNPCGLTSAPRTRTIIIGSPTIPASITGISNGVCGQTVNYQCPPQAGATFTWSSSLPVSITGQGTNSVSITYGTFSTGTVSVTASNSCGTSPTRTISVKGSPNTPSVITANPVVWCNNDAGIVFSSSLSGVSGLYTLNWSVTPLSAATYVSGQGTSSYTVDWGVGNATVSLTASNACGNATRNYAATTSCRESGEIAATDNTSRIKLYPNPAAEQVTVSYLAEETEEVSILMKDVSGRLIYSTIMKSQAGENTMQMEVSKLAKGVYMVEVKSNTAQDQIRLVVQ